MLPLLANFGSERRSPSSAILPIRAIDRFSVKKGSFPKRYRLALWKPAEVVRTRAEVVGDGRLNGQPATLHVT